MDRSKPETAMRPLRVLIIAPSTNILGGQAVQASRLVAQLRQEPTIEVGFLPINPEFPRRLRRLQKVRYARTIINSALYGIALLDRVRTFDVIHVFSASYFSFLLAPTPAIFTSRLYGKRVVLNYRSGEAEDHLQRWRRTAGFVLRRADAIAVPSRYLVDVFGKFGLQARSIFNIVDTDLFRFRERRPLRPIFLCNRSLEPLYNVACVLRAFALIQRRFPEARLILAGDGKQRPELERLAGELNLRNTEFLGRVEPGRINEVYDSADIFLNGSNIDNMPGSIIEAFASGLPVITTNAGGIPWIVTDGETGFLVGCGDYQAMAARATTLLEDQNLALRLALNARDECSKYAWHAVRDEWLQLYRELGNTFRGEPTTVQKTDSTCRGKAQI